jgi:ketosteroid isomerase-like protein
MPMTDRDRLLAANASFYAAFARGDLESMSALWADDDGISCVHPGWPALVGRKDVGGSWRDILGDAASRTVAVRDPYAIVAGGEGRVLCVEAIGGHLLQAANHFRLIDGAWRLVHHQSSLIAAAPAPVVPPGVTLN